MGWGPVQKIVFIDRDGVICENHDDYVKSWPEFSFLPNSLEALAKLTQAGYRIIVVTNQSAVGRGLLDLETLHDIHSRMIAIVEQHGGRIERVMVCPHRPEDKCRCRKPQPGMLLTAAQELGLDLTSAFMIGDACTDVQAGQAAGCRSFLVLTGRGLSQLAMTMHQAKTNFHVVPGLDIAVEHILNNEETVTLSFTPMILPVS
jgi:D-glycero-D-manno-heptose 1,7-bisphosphate phosphatase